MPSSEEMRAILHKKRSKNLRFRTTPFFMYQILSNDPVGKSMGFFTILIDSKQRHKSVGNMEHVREPKDFIIFFIYD